LPDYYYQKPSAKRGTYLFSTTDPLFVFGYGLSYTRFQYENPTVFPQKIGPSQHAHLRIDVKNAGARSGEEVVQLYIHHVVSSVTQPIKELRGFQRVNVQPGESKTVEFEITPDMLSFLDKNMKPTIEPGRIELMVGGNSADLLVVPLDVLDSDH
jgi:beta-glucosidase